LSLDEFRVGSIILEQRFVSATLGDTPCLHDHDFICVANSAQSVGNDDNVELATLDEQVQSLLHLVLRLSVERRSGLVQKKQLWLADQGTSDSDPLLLTARKLETTLSYHCLVAEWEKALIVDEVVSTGLLASLIKHLFQLVLSVRSRVESVENVRANIT